MLDSVHAHLRHHVVAYVALFFALTAPASAAVITGVMIKDGSVTGIDIKDDSLKGVDVDESDLGKVPSSETADRAPVSGYEVTAATVRSLSFPEPGTRLSTTAACPAGKKAVGGFFDPIAGGFMESGPEPATPVAVNGAGVVNIAGSSGYFADVSFTEGPPGEATHFRLNVEAVCVDAG